MFKLTDLNGRIYYAAKKDNDSKLHEIVFEIRTASCAPVKTGGPRWRVVYLDPELTQEVAIRTDQIYLVEEVEND